MAVLEAVRGWQELAGLPHIGEAEKEKEAGGGDNAANKEEEKMDDEAEEEEEERWTAEKLENDLDTLLNMDYVSLLL